jgi:hypothetical protein
MGIIPRGTRCALATGTLLVLALASSAPAQEDCGRIAPGTPVSWVGRYTNVRSSEATGEAHEYGYTVDLWKAGACVIGRLLVHEGLVGHARAIRLESPRYDRKSGTLAFKARVSYRENSGGVPRVRAKREFAFAGHLGDRILAGEIVDGQILPPNPLKTKERVRLGKITEESALPAFRSYGEWEAWTNNG